MLEAAIAGQDGFSIDEIELQRRPPSYTIDTIEALRARDPSTELYYLLGHDNVADLPKWHRFSDLQKLVRFVVLDRTGEKANHPHLVIGRKIDISATEIRNRVASHQSIRYLVPPAVEEIICSRRLYQEN